MKEKIKAVMVCAAGMSSSLLCERIEKAGAEEGIEMEVISKPSMTYKEIGYDDVDVVLIAPQVRGQTDEITEYIHNLLNLDIPIVPIGFQEYGLVKGDVVLENILKAIGND
jgi:PTS system cellobiose-specific IIB component